MDELRPYLLQVLVADAANRMGEVTSDPFQAQIDKNSCLKPFLYLLRT
jgi:hypothetical protein